MIINVAAVAGAVPPTTIVVGSLRLAKRFMIWGPMAYAIIGGLFVAAMLTLLFLPALYVARLRVKEPVPVARISSTGGRGHRLSDSHRPLYREMLFAAHRVHQRSYPGAWHGRDENPTAGQQAVLSRARANWAASVGDCTDEMEVLAGGTDDPPVRAETGAAIDLRVPAGMRSTMTRD
jgi:hypothetical protein